MDRKIILFELNEVPLRIFEHFRRAHPEAALARLWDNLSRYETHTTDQGWLEPWITWPTLHRGVADDRHRISDFGQELSAQDAEFPPLWKLLAARGVRSGIFGSLHTYPLPERVEDYDFFIPDTFAAGSECFPHDISLFQEFNLSLARESARNISSRVPWKSALALLQKAPGLGFKLDTFADLGRQLVSERVHSWQKTRRRSYQAVLGFDIFMKQLAEHQPAFATFFTNHVASSMHRYWAATFPGDYPSFEYSDQWVHTFEHEIDFTMGKFDRFFGKLVQFTDRHPEYQLWVATSMGQAATEARPCESQLYLTHPDRFMHLLGVPPEHWSRRPAMLPQCNVFVEGAYCAPFREQLRKLTIEGQPMLYREAEGGFFSLDFGQEGFSGREAYVHLDGRQIPFPEAGLEAVRIDDQTWSSAYHIPQGSLLIYDPRNRAPKPGVTKISTQDIAPAILNNFSVPVPGYMQPAASLV